MKLRRIIDELEQINVHTVSKLGLAAQKAKIASDMNQDPKLDELLRGLYEDIQAVLEFEPNTD